MADKWRQSLGFNLTYLALAVSLLGVVSGGFFLGPEKATAAYSSNIPSSAAPSYIISDIDAHCDPSGSYRWTVYQNEWISPANTPNQTTVTVPYGTQNIPLQLNWITYRCKYNDPTTTSGSFIEDSISYSSGSSDFTKLNNGKDGFIGDLPYVSTSTTGYRSGNYGTFTYRASSALKSSTTVSITLNTRGTVTNTTQQSYYCAVVSHEPQVPTTDPHNFAPQPGYCKSGSNTFSIGITVQPATTYTLTGRTTVSPTTLSPGSTVTFTHYVKNSGPANASYCYIFQRQYPGDSGITNFSPSNGGGVQYNPGSTCTAKAGGYFGANTTTAAGVETNVGSYVTAIPSTATNGQQYCQRIFYTEASGPGTASGAGSLACATVQVTTTSSPGSCPGDLTIQGNTLVKIPLPDPEAGTSYETAPPPSSSPSTTTTRYTPDKTVVTVVGDISIGGSRDGNITLGGADTGRLNMATSTEGQAIVDYKPYTKDYPYDRNQAQVTYTTYYKTQTYTASSSPSGYTCPNNTNEFQQGNNCFKPNSTPPGSVACPPGVVAQCCPSPNYLPQTVNGTTSCYDDDTSIPYYNYTLSSTSSSDAPLPGSSGTTANGYNMKACYDRNFSVSNVTVSTGLSPDPEDPQTANSSGSATVTLMLNYGGIGLRNGLVVNGLSYNITHSTTYGCTNSGSFNANTGLTNNGTSTTVFVASTSCSATAPPLKVGDTVCQTYTVNPTGDTVDDTGTIISNNGLSTSGNGCSGPVENEPYLKVFGGDVSAGNGFYDTAAAKCTNSTTDAIAAWNRGASDYNGAGTQLAALVNSGNIDQFVTGYGGSSGGNGTSSVMGTSSPLPSALAFANSSSATNEGQGLGSHYGIANGAAECQPDYMSKASGGEPPSTDVSQLNGTYTHNGDITLNASTDVAASNHVTLYVKGNVYIASNIQYPANVSGVAAIPSFQLVASGDIYINSSVGQLDGSYIAQGHTIYTCATGLSSANSDFNTCSQKRLVVNGAFAAADIKFYRLGGLNSLNGSLRYSTTDTGAGTNNGSEEFDYTPMLWLSQQIRVDKNTPYDSITSLPPVL